MLKNQNYNYFIMILCIAIFYLILILVKLSEIAPSDFTMWRLIMPHTLCIHPVAQMRKLKYSSAVFIGETNTLNSKLIRSQL